MDITEFYVFHIPVGVRCLVSSARGETVARSISGGYLKKFQSLLPGGKLKE